MYDYSNFTDQQLFVLLKRKDHGAYTEIYDRYFTVLYLHARHILRNENLAQDAVHDVFTMIWNKAGTFELTHGLDAYLFRSVKNVILNGIRHEKVAGNYIADLKRFYEEAHSSTDELVQLNELKRLIEEEIQRLPSEIKKVFELSRKKHLTNAEIANELQKSEQTVKNQIKRALQILRKNLDLPVSVIIMLLK